MTIGESASSATTRERLAWGRDVHGRAVHIGEVSRGLACRCVCPDCDEPLVAHHGALTAWHFKHHRLTGCRGESALHLAGKQALVDAAAAGEAVSLPSSYGTVERVDGLGRAVKSAWRVECASPLVTAADCEVALARDTRTDVLVRLDDRDHTTAIEIGVTHAKDAADRAGFERLRQDALEIDLSQLAWDSGPDTIRRAVLSDAPRVWLFHGAAVSASEVCARRAEQQVVRHNDSDQRRLDEWVAAIRDNGLLQKRRSWPTLVEPDRSQYEEPSRVSPAVTHIDDTSWRRGDDRWTGAGTVSTGAGRSARVNLVVAHERQFAVPAEMNGPTLCIQIPETAADGPLRAQTLALKWISISHWLDALARRGHTRRATRRLPHGMGRAYDFVRATRQEQMDLIARYWHGDRRGPSCRHSSPAWGTDFEIWTSIVWQIEVRPVLSGNGRVPFCDVSEIHRSRQIGELLSLPDDPVMRQQRLDDLQRWFGRLDELGYVLAIDAYRFEPGFAVPSTFRPYTV